MSGSKDIWNTVIFYHIAFQIIIILYIIYIYFFLRIYLYRINFNNYNIYTKILYIYILLNPRKDEKTHIYGIR